MEKPAVLIVDMQKGFLREEVYPGFNATVTGIISSIKKLVEHAHRLGIPVVHTAVVHHPYNYPRFARSKPFGANASEDDVAIIDDVKPSPQDFVVKKCRYNGFESTELEILLRNIQVDTLLVAGIATEVCVESTVRGALDRDFKVIVLEDCTATKDESTKETSLRNMQNLGRGLEVDSSVQVLGRLLEEAKAGQRMSVTPSDK